MHVKLEETQECSAETEVWERRSCTK